MSRMATNACDRDETSRGIHIRRLYQRNYRDVDLCSLSAYAPGTPATCTDRFADRRRWWRPLPSVDVNAPSPPRLSAIRLAPVSSEVGEISIRASYRTGECWCYRAYLLQTRCVMCTRVVRHEYSSTSNEYTRLVYSAYMVGAKLYIRRLSRIMSTERNSVGFNFDILFLSECKLLNIRSTPSSLILCTIAYIRSIVYTP